MDFDLDSSSWCLLFLEMWLLVVLILDEEGVRDFKTGEYRGTDAFNGVSEDSE